MIMMMMTKVNTCLNSVHFDLGLANSGPGLASINLGLES